MESTSPPVEMMPSYRCGLLPDPVLIELFKNVLPTRRAGNIKTDKVTELTGLIPLAG